MKTGQNRVAKGVTSRRGVRGGVCRYVDRGVFDIIDRGSRPGKRRLRKARESQNRARCH